jgi:hypothetical protein
MERPSTEARKIIAGAANAAELKAAWHEAQAEAERTLKDFQAAFDHAKYLHGQRRKKAFANVRKLHRRACKASRHLRAAAEAVSSWNTFIQGLESAGVPLFRSSDLN